MRRDRARHHSRGPWCRRRPHLPLERAQVDPGEAVLGLLVGFLLVDLGLAGGGEGGLDREEAEGAVAGHLQIGTALHDALRAGDEVLQVQGTVALLGPDLVAEQLPVGGEQDGGNGLPAVIYAVVEGFLLGPERAASRAEYNCGRKKCN